jgi:NADH-quinone oxidoreductase subunit A
LADIVKKITKSARGGAMDFDLQTYYPVFLFLMVVLLFAAANLVATHLIGPGRRTPVKLMPYESGMDPVGDARQRFDVRFYLVAILFLVFDVELLFLYPWAVAAYSGPNGEGGAANTTNKPSLLPGDLKDVVFWEVIVFLVTLAVAYVYAWRKGVFRWR